MENISQSATISTPPPPPLFRAYITLHFLARNSKCYLRRGRNANYVSRKQLTSSHNTLAQTCSTNECEKLSEKWTFFFSWVQIQMGPRNRMMTMVFHGHLSPTSPAALQHGFLETSSWTNLGPVSGDKEGPDSSSFAALGTTHADSRHVEGCRLQHSCALQSYVPQRGCFHLFLKA